jgi:hypothetical protein
MKFLILGDAIVPPRNYRGVDRHKPTYQQEYSEDSPINQSFLWSTNVHEKGFLEDLDNGKLLTKLYQSLPDPKIFEIIEITHHNQQPSIGKELIGYDVVCNTHSLLSDGMTYCTDAAKALEIGSLICLIQDYFRPQLNSNFLFPNYEIGLKCLGCMKQLNALVPQYNLWEMNHLSYVVAGLYLVD